MSDSITMAIVKDINTGNEYIGAIDGEGTFFCWEKGKEIALKAGEYEIIKQENWP